MRPPRSALLALALLALAPPALADDVSDEDIEEAFATGLGAGFEGEATLDLERYGRTLVLRGARAGAPDPSPIELTCMLCSVDEALGAARSMGAELAGRAEQGGDPSFPDLPPGAEPEPRPLWVPTLLTGIGVAAAAAGTALLLLDGDCASTRIDAEGDCSQIHDLAPAGWGMVSAGAVSVVTGVVLFILFAGEESDPEVDP
jgi:hypothetical protein